MAFNFIVEDGSGVAGANSYVTVEEATDILIPNFRDSAVWDQLDTDQREKLLVLATSYIDENYFFHGSKADRNQSLRWPRKGMRDNENMCLADCIIPIELKKAVARLSVWTFANDPDEALNARGIKRFRSDDLEIEFQSGFEGQFAPDFLRKLLGTFGYGPNDRGFKPITRV